MMVLSNPAAHLLWALLAVNIIKGSLVFLAAFLFTRFVKRISPEHKHILWFLVLISFVALPVTWLALPGFTSRIQISTGISETWRLTAAPFISRGLYMDHVYKAYNFAVFPRETEAAIITNVLIILGGVWLAGLFFYLGRFLTATVTLKRISRQRG